MIKFSLKSALFVVLFSIALILAIILMVQALSANNAKLAFSGDIEKTSFTGEYSINLNPYKPYTTGTQLTLYPETFIILKGHFSNTINAGTTIILRISDMHVVIRKNGEIIFSYGGAYTSSITKSSGNLWKSFTSPGITPEDKIEISLSNYYAFSLLSIFDDFMNNIYYGSEYLLFTKLMPSALPNLLLSIIMIFIGLTIIVFNAVGHYFKIVQQGNNIYLAIGLIALSIWFLMDYNIISYIIPYPVFNNLLRLNCVYISSIFLCLHAASVLSGSVKAIFTIGSVAFTLVVLIANLMQAFTQDTDIYDLLPYYVAVIIVLTATGIIFSLRYMIKHKPDKSMKPYYYFLPLMAGALIEGCNAFTDTFAANYFIKVGFLIFGLMKLWEIAKLVAKRISEIENTNKLERELLQNRITVMLCQIQPHFIFNTLNAINGLCTTNPKKANDAIIDFSDYLRSNINSLQSNALIDFSKELEHIEHYVRLEQMRFGNKIKCVYDIQFSTFQLPTLTIQPIVENAIKHGISGKKDGGTVTIKTVKSGSDAIITISDDGCGFDKTNENHKGHISTGLQNIKTRLDIQCGGSISIKSVTGIGTDITITIPMLQRV